MTVNVHHTTLKTASLNTEFGQKLALDKLGLNLDQLELLVGRFIKGKNKGNLKGDIVWQKTEKGGWDYDSQSVIYPGSRNYRIARTCYNTDGGCYTYNDIVYSGSSKLEIIESKKVKDVKRNDLLKSVGKVADAQAVERAVMAKKAIDWNNLQLSIEQQQTMIKLDNQTEPLALVKLYWAGYITTAQALELTNN